MRIAYVCISHKQLGRNSSGGLEVFTETMLPSLVQNGIDIDLIASSDTDMRAFPGCTLVPAFDPMDLSKIEGEHTEKKEFVLSYAMLQYVGMAKAMQQTYDLIHFNCAQWYIPFILNPKTCPVLTTIHGLNIRQTAIDYLLHQFSGPHIACVSNSICQSVVSYPNHHVIYNGIDLMKFPFRETAGTIFGWLGRIAPVKGLKEALLASKLAGVTFRAHGSVDYKDYYHQEVEPLLDAEHTLSKPIFKQDKALFFGNLQAFLMPVCWNEPFGFAAIESMACGTPVIAYNRGAVPEIVEDGVTGLIVEPDEKEIPKIQITHHNQFQQYNAQIQNKQSNWIIKKKGVEGLVEAIKTIQSMSKYDYLKMRKNCRKRVEERFTLERMVREYIDYYQEIIKN